jgi:general secretion pathway protein G
MTEQSGVDVRPSPTSGWLANGRARWRTERGFTLIELILSLLIAAILLSIALTFYNQVNEKYDIVRATSDIIMISSAIERYYATNGQFPASLSDVGYSSALDPWGHPYRYLNITTTKGNREVRKDHNLVPLNTDFDLYSMGEDGKSASPLTAKASRDDIVRAHDGGFVGLASDY